MKRMKRLGCLLLTLTMAASFWSCASSNGPADTTTRAPESTTVPKETSGFETAPDTTVGLGRDPVGVLPGNLSGDEAATAQLRLFGVRAGWKNVFNHELGCFAVASTVEELQALMGLNTAFAGLDVSDYDEAFFTENCLVLIPRSSNSGSVRYQALVNVEGEMLHIELDAKMPEMGTADMAEWLVLVRLPRAQYSEDLTVTVPAPGGDTSGTVTK